MNRLLALILSLFVVNLVSADDISIADYVKYEQSARLTYQDGLRSAETTKNPILVWFKFSPEQVIPLYKAIKDPIINVFLDNLDNFPVSGPTLLVGQWKNGQVIQLKTIKSNFLQELDNVLHPKPIIVKNSQHKTTPGPNDHAHTCTYCGTTWYHDDSNYGNRAAHMCPNCGEGPFYNKSHLTQITQPNLIQPRLMNYCPTGRT